MIVIDRRNFVIICIGEKSCKEVIQLYFDQILVIHNGRIFNS